MNKNISIVFFLAAIVIIGAAIYANSLQAPFNLDSQARIANNSHIRINSITYENLTKAVFNEQASKNRPLPNLSFALNYYFNAYDVKYYHIVNILLHLVTGVLLFFLFQAMLHLRLPEDTETRPTLIAFSAALIWLVHPVHTQSVTYIVQRSNIMAALFCICSLWFYTIGRAQVRSAKGRTALAAAAISWFLALACKQNAAIFPFLILLYEWFFYQDLSKAWLKNNLKYFFCFGLVLTIVAFVYLGSDPLGKLSSLRDFSESRFTLTERVLTQFRVVVHYLSIFFWPHPSRLNLDHDFPLSQSFTDPITTLLGSLFLTGLLLMGFLGARRYRLVSFCIFWYFVNLAIESTVIPLAVIFEHRTYMPYMGVALCSVVLVDRILKIPSLKVALVLLVSAAFAFWTYQRNEIWREPVSLWQDAAAKSPNKARPHNNLGLAQLDLGRYDEAIAQFESVLAIEPGHIEAINSLGLAWQHKNLTSKAIQYFKTALTHEPRDAMTLNNLGAAYMKLNEIEAAVDQFELALRINAEMSPAHTNLGIALIQTGDFKAGVEHLEKAVVLDPENENARVNLNRARILRQEVENQIGKLHIAIRQEPGNSRHHANLSTLHQSIGNNALAIDALNQALKIEPGSDILLNDLGNLYLALERYSEAQQVFMRHLEQAPDFSLPYFNMARWHAKQDIKAEALAWLKKAIERGYANWEQIESDADLKAVRKMEAYTRLKSERRK